MMDNNAFFHITIITAIFAFSIPVFWTLAKDRLVDLKKAGDDVVRDLLPSYFAKKLVKKLGWLFWPFSIASAITVFAITPLLATGSISILWSYVSSGVVFIISVLALDLYRKIYISAQKEANEEISNFGNISNIVSEENIAKFMNSVFREEDRVLAEEYGVSIKELTESFFNEIDKSLEGSDVNKLMSYREIISIMENTIEKRQIDNLLIKSNIVEKIMKLHADLWWMSYSLLGGDDKRWSYFSMLFRELDALLVEISNLSIEKGLAFIFLEDIKKHIEKNKDKNITNNDKDYYYLEQFPFAKLFFENAKKLSDKNAWPHIPDKWLLRAENLGENKEVINFMLKQYGEWLQPKINLKDDWSKDLEEVHLKWIPEVNTKAWAYIISYRFRPWGDSRIGSLIRKRPNFGWIGRTFIWSGDISDDEIDERMKKTEDERVRNAIELSQKIAGLRFSKEEVDKIIQEAESYKPKNKEEEAGQEYVLYLWGEIKKYLDEQDDANEKRG